LFQIPARSYIFVEHHESREGSTEVEKNDVNVRFCATQQELDRDVKSSTAIQDALLSAESEWSSLRAIAAAFHNWITGTLTN